VYTSGMHVNAPDGTLKQTVDWFWNEVNKLGHAPWGGEGHEIGATFWATYSQALDGVAGAVAGIADNLDRLRRGLLAAGVTYQNEYFVHPTFNND